MRWILGLIGLIAIVVFAGYFVLKRDDIPYETLAAKYESAASRYVDLPGGVRMHYCDEGARPSASGPSAPTILLIHGFSASLQTWEPWVERLGAQGYRIVSIDLPGHGLTRAPAGYRASVEAFRDAVYAFTQAQHLTRFAIAGNSMGGNVAWEYALAHPEQLDALILVDSAGWPHRNEGALNTSPMMRLLRTPVIGPMLKDLDNSRVFRDALRSAYADPAHATDAIVARYVETSRAPGHRDILLQLQMDYAGRRAASSAVLAAIATPTLILWGRQDHLIPVSDAERFRDAIHGSQMIVYDDAGHLPQEEVPDQSALAVKEFLYRIYEGGALAAE
jgi:pimeloyl-ACP methyl ester carboxylesterase